MKLVSVRKDLSPDHPGFVRLTGTVERESGDGTHIWFETPAACATDLSESADPWIIATRVAPGACDNRSIRHLISTGHPPSS